MAQANRFIVTLNPDALDGLMALSELTQVGPETLVKRLANSHFSFWHYQLHQDGNYNVPDMPEPNADQTARLHRLLAPDQPVYSSPVETIGSYVDSMGGYLEDAEQDELPDPYEDGNWPST
jgi:hypothetical protein